MTTTPNKWTFWFFWIAGNALAWGLGFAAGFAFYWWMGEREDGAVFVLPILLIVSGIQWFMLHFLLHRHPTYQARSEKVIPIGVSFISLSQFITFAFIFLLLGPHTEFQIIPDSSLLVSGIFVLLINFFLLGEFFTFPKTLYANDRFRDSTVFTILVIGGISILVWQFSKFLTSMPIPYPIDFSGRFLSNLIIGAIQGLLYAFSTLWALRNVWTYETLHEDAFFGIEPREILKVRLISRRVFAGSIILMFGWSILVALRPCNGLDRILERSGCMEQIRDIGERWLGLATVSQDGKWLAYSTVNIRPKTIVLWNLNERKIAWSANLPEGDLGIPEFSPNMALLAYKAFAYLDERTIMTQMWSIPDGQFVETITRSKLPREITLFPSKNNTFVFDLSAQQLWDWNLRNPVILQGPNFEMTIHSVGSGSDRWFIMGRVADNWQTWQVKNGLLSQVDTIESKESEMFEQIRQTLPTEYVENNLFIPSGKDYYILQTDRAFQLWRLPSP